MEFGNEEEGGFLTGRHEGDEEHEGEGDGFALRTRSSLRRKGGEEGTKSRLVGGAWSSHDATIMLSLPVAIRSIAAL
jgi:hypothetical protein